MFKLKVRHIAAAVAAATLMALVGVTPASAYNATSNYYYSGGRSLQANVWIGTTMPFGYQTSTKYLGSGSGPSTASSITNTARMFVSGIGVSLGNASGGTQGPTDFASTWTNYNSWISDRAGTNSAAGAWLFISASSDGSANIPYFGSPRTVSATTQRWL